MKLVHISDIHINPEPILGLDSIANFKKCLAYVEAPDRKGRFGCRFQVAAVVRRWRRARQCALGRKQVRHNLVRPHH